MQIARATGIALAVAAIAGITSVLVFVPLPVETELWSSIYNCGHAPLFGVFALLMFWLLPRSCARSGWAHYATTLGGAIAVGLLTEVVQHFSGGDFEFEDVARDTAGAFLFLAFLASFDPRALSALRLDRRGSPALIRAAALALMAFIWIPAALLARDYARRDIAFPVLFDAQQPWGRPFLRLQGAKLRLSDPPDRWKNVAHGPLALVSFSHQRYPGIAIQEPYPDWTGYRLLTFAVISDQKTRLAVRIDDARHSDGRQDRYTGAFDVGPGFDVISIPLDAIRQAPRGRSMDMTRIRKIVIFAVQAPAAFSVMLGPIRLQH